jgi:hypothetical protein
MMGIYWIHSQAKIKGRCDLWHKYWSSQLKWTNHTRNELYHQSITNLQNCSRRQPTESLSKKTLMNYDSMQ